MATTLPICPRCFQPKFNTSTAPPRVGPIGENDIDGKIKRAESLISMLIIGRSRLLKRRNKTQSPIYSLPPEILALIFQFACPPADFWRTYGVEHAYTESPYWYPSGATTREGAAIVRVLSTVSAYWNNVVSSTPSLWKSFIAGTEDLYLMQTIFKRSRLLPVSVSINCPGGWTLNESSIIVSLLREHSSRIHMLHLDDASPTWIKQHLPNFQNVKHLSFDTIQASGTTQISIDSPCAHLVLKNIDVRISLSWSKIKILHLEFIPVEVCLEMLQKCTQLVEFKVKEWGYDEDCGEIELPHSPFILPHLKVFRWNIDDKDFVHRAMLRHVRMPVLETLSWFYPSIPLPSSYISGFFERLPLTLSEIEIIGGRTPSSGSSIIRLLLTLPNVERLILRGWTSSDFVNGILNDLASAELPLSPKLKSISIESLEDSHLFKQTRVIRTLHRYCATQSKRPNDRPFRLEFMERRVEWLPKIKKTLIRMVEKGCMVELWEDSKPVDWLPRPVGRLGRSCGNLTDTEATDEQ